MRRSPIAYILACVTRSEGAVPSGAEEGTDAVVSDGLDGFAEVAGTQKEQVNAQHFIMSWAELQLTPQVWCEQSTCRHC